MDSENYLNVLNAEQKEAVVYDGDSLLILAGAGSGKTRVITTKIAWQIAEQHTDPAGILALTFTKKAANEMRERAVLLEERARFAHLRTFHSWGAYFLRLYAEEANLSKNFTVYDDDDMVTLVGKAIPSITRKEAAHIAHNISLAKDYGLTPESDDFSVVEEAGFFELRDEVFLEQYAEYQKRLRATGNADFGDLILLPYQILKNNANIRRNTHLRYRRILVDEYQDSNVAQFLLLQQLVGVEENAGIKVCVVGDDDQSIYRFRGAEVQNILRFEDYFPNTKIIRLEANYRSTPQILTCSGNLISHNEERLGKTLHAAGKADGKKPVLVFLPNQDDETQFCGDLIENQHKRGVPYSDWAILYRTNAQSLGFESDFLHRKIPYTVVGSLKFYEREEIKDALSWLSFIVNPRDEVSFRRIVNKPVRGIGNTSQDKIIDACIGENLLLGAKKVKLSKKTQEGFTSFVQIVEELTSILNTQNTSESDSNENPNQKKLSAFLEAVIKKSGLEELYASQDEISQTQKVSNLHELVNGASLYPNSVQGLLDFLDSINLDRSLEASEAQEDAKDAVTLITLHNTKGLEFERVIITGMEYGVFPRENKEDSELEEERRLFYVGLTRAKQELYLTSCAVRRLYGRTNYMQPSPFLSELGNSTLRILGTPPAQFALGEEKPVHSLSKKWAKGKSVYHDDWGEGQIVKTGVTSDGEYWISVLFASGGEKRFLPQYQQNTLMLED